MKSFLEELKTEEETTDLRIPAGAVIYHKIPAEIVFSSKQELVATPTAFSSFGAYGLELLLPVHFYYLPQKKLTKKEIFQHGYYIWEKEHDSRYFVALALFYWKYRAELKKINPAFGQLIERIHLGKKELDYPSQEEIRARAEVYDLRF